MINSNMRLLKFLQEEYVAAYGTYGMDTEGYNYIYRNPTAKEISNLVSAFIERMGKSYGLEEIDIRWVAYEPKKSLFIWLDDVDIHEDVVEFLIRKGHTKPPGVKTLNAVSWGTGNYAGGYAKVSSFDGKLIIKKTYSLNPKKKWNFLKKYFINYNDFFGPSGKWYKEGWELETED